MQPGNGKSNGKENGKNVESGSIGLYVGFQRV